MTKGFPSTTLGLVLLRFGEAPWEEGLSVINDFRGGETKDFESAAMKWFW